MKLRTLAALTLLIMPGPMVGQQVVSSAEELRARASQTEGVPIGVLAGRNRPIEETFGMPSALAALLASVPAQARIDLQGFPTGPGERRAVALRRVDVYAPETRIFVVDEEGQKEIPRSRRMHFVGHASGDPETRLVLSLDPDRGTLRGAVHTPEGASVIEDFNQDIAAQAMIIRESSHALESQGIQLHSSCGSDILAAEPAPLDLVFRSQPLQSVALAAAAPTRSAVIAVDTDNELNYYKFGNNTTLATDWIADLFAQMNVMFENDLSLRLLQGDTFLRIDGDTNFDNDPYNVNSSGAGGAHLDEFGVYWQANMGHVQRTFAALLSGKAGSIYSASGIAWLDGFCESQSSGGGYSVNQVFKANVPVINDAKLVGHELGHNMGSPHTHCYSPVVDQCYAGQGGCYGGPTSCPSGGSGTLMSYCHLLSGCGAAASVHSRVATLIDGYLNSHAGWCIAPVGGGAIFNDDFEAGGLGSWSP